MKICFTADSTIDVSSEFIEKYPVEILPLKVDLNGTFYKDGVDITPDQIIKAVSEGSPLPKTSAVNPDEYRECFTRLLKDCDAVIHFNISSEFSSCHQNARIGAEGLNVFCIDSRNLSTGTALLLGEAYDLYRAGADAAEIAERVNAMRDKADVSFIIDRLDYLYKGGRCSMLSMLGANLLHLRPCIEVKDGKMGVGKKYRGSYSRCLSQYIADRLSEPDAIDTKRVFLTHTGVSPELEAQVRETVQKTLPFSEIFCTRAGATVTSHCGENTFGILMMRK